MEVGAVHDTVDVEFPLLVAAGVPGGPGTVDGMAGAEAAEYGPVPAALMAATSKTYAVPLVRPITAKGLAGAALVAVVQVEPLLLE